jgi:hypothetical protein
MTNETQTQVGREARVPLEKRVVVLSDGKEIKFSDLHPQRKEVLYDLNRKLPQPESVNYPGWGNCSARVELNRELDIPDMYHKMGEDNGFELMKSFFAGDILGRCDNQGRILYRSGKFRHSMNLGFSVGFDSAKGYVNYSRNIDFEVNNGEALVYDCPADCKFGTRGRLMNQKDESCFGHCVVGYKGVKYTAYVVNFQDGKMNWNSMEPGVIELKDNYGGKEIVTDPKRIDVLREHAREMWTTEDKELRGSKFPSLADMWSLREKK